MIKLNFSAAIIALIVLTGCTTQNDIVPPSGSTISMPADATVTGGVQYTIHAAVQDPDGNTMNGVAVVFMSSNSSVASFSSTSAVSKTSVETDKYGIATITVYTFSGITGDAEITGDILVATKGMKLTVK